MKNTSNKAYSIETIGDRLAFILSEIGMKNYELAEKLRKDPSDVSRWRKNKAQIPTELIEGIVNITGFSADWLLTGAGSRQRDGGDLKPIEPCGASQDSVSPHAGSPTNKALDAENLSEAEAENMEIKMMLDVLREVDQDFAFMISGRVRERYAAVMKEKKGNHRPEERGAGAVE